MPFGNSQDLQVFYLVELLICSRWSFKPDEKQQIYDELMSQVFQDFIRIGDFFLQRTELHANFDAIYLVKSILKISNIILRVRTRIFLN